MVTCIASHGCISPGLISTWLCHQTQLAGKFPVAISLLRAPNYPWDCTTLCETILTKRELNLTQDEMISFLNDLVALGGNLRLSPETTEDELSYQCEALLLRAIEGNTSKLVCHICKRLTASAGKPPTTLCHKLWQKICACIVGQQLKASLLEILPSLIDVCGAIPDALAADIVLSCDTSALSTDRVAEIIALLRSFMHPPRLWGGPRMKASNRCTRAPVELIWRTEH